MKVYLVIESEPYEGSDVVSIHATKKGALKKAIELRSAQWVEYYENTHRRVMLSGFHRGEKFHWLDCERKPSRQFTIREADLRD